MKNKHLRLLLAFALTLTMFFNSLPPTTFASSTENGTTYVRVNSVDELVPNARYIIIGEYAVEGVETDYFAMSTSINTYDDIRVGYTATTYVSEDNPHFVMAEDKQSLTLYSNSILKVRLRSTTYGSHKDLYKIEVDGEGFLYGFCNSYYYYGTSCCRELAISKNTKGRPWWHFKMGDNNYWQISTYLESGGSTDIVSIAFNEVYGDFMSYLYADNCRIDGETYFFNTFINEDNATNIWLYREVCPHDSSLLTHVSEVTPNCSAPGRVEHWYCSGCETHFANQELTQKINIADTIIPATPHSDSCGHAVESAKFELCTDAGTSSSQHGKRYILLGKANDKYYAMGNVTNEDGSRNAIEVTPNENGVITASSLNAEFITFDYDNGVFGFTADGGYFSAIDGKIITYDKSLYQTSDYIPKPSSFRVDNYDTGAGSFISYSVRDLANEYICFDSENLCFVSTDTNNSIINTTYIYQELCSHNHGNFYHTQEQKPTCTEQGSQEYWYCSECYNYFQNNNFEKPIESDSYVSPETFTLDALGHEYNDEGVCKNCGMKRHVYTQVSSLEDFDKLSENASYIIVFKDNGKTYAASLPQLVNPYEIDKDGDGVYDIIYVDENSNGVPDCIEKHFYAYCNTDINEDGVVDALDCELNVGDITGDGVIGIEDYIIFFNDYYWDFYYLHEEEMYNCENYVEVTIAQDGSITITDEGAMEFQLMDAGIWGGSPYFEEDFEYYEIDKETERICAMWVPNFWIAYNGQMGYYSKDHFMFEKRAYGDGKQPGVIDNKNWKISFNQDGTVSLVCSWEDYYDTAALQFAKFLNADGIADATIVGMPEDFWADSPIMSQRTALLPAYLYASEPAYDHVHDFQSEIIREATHTSVGIKRFSCTTCNHYYDEEIPKLEAHEFGDWKPEATVVGVHYRECECGERETGNCTWNEGEITQEATHLEPGEITYTCTVCGATKTEEIPRLEAHEFGDWKPEATVVGVHYRECACGERETGNCTWNEGEITEEATYEKEGEMTYTCTICGGTKTERIEMLEKTEQIVDENTEIKITVCEGSSAILNQNTTLVAEEITQEIPQEAQENIAQEYGATAEIVVTYDISLMLDGAQVQPGGNVAVTIPLPQDLADYDQIIVVYIDSQNNVSVCESTLNEDGTITFITDHFSNYAIVGVNNVEENSSNGGCLSSISSGFACTVVLAMLSALVFVKKRRY